MSSSPAWLTVALTTLATSTTPTPHDAFTSGIRAVPTTHVLHHLNRWSRHVWRPAVSPRALSALTRAPSTPDVTQLADGAVVLLSALVDAVRRCDATAWLGVLGVMFLADDPWAVDVGLHQAPDADRASAAMHTLFAQPQLLADAAKLSQHVPDFANGDEQHAPSHEAFAELRCRIAALQLQLDDVTAVVRRNEKNTTDLLSSFHFWSLLLLDELRGYRQENLASDSRGGRDAAFEAFSRQLSGTDGSQSGSDRGERREAPASPPRNPANNVTDPPALVHKQRPKRVFRDGKWVVL